MFMNLDHKLDDVQGNLEDIKKSLMNLQSSNDQAQFLKSIELKQDVNIDWMRSIGEGGFGKVYQGVYASIERVAIKVFKANALTPTERLNLMREVKIHCELSSSIPGVVRMFGAKLQGDMQYLVLELAKGAVSELTRPPATKILNLVHKLEILLQVAHTMKAIHALGIIHRDLKPENLLIFDHPELAFKMKLADFGFSKLVQDNRSVVVDQRGNQNNVIKGTFAYLPPETLNNVAPSFKTDVYACGIMANEILRQVPPFSDESFQSGSHLSGEGLLLHVKQGNRPFLLDELKNVTTNHDSLLLACQDLIKSCWHQLAEKRPSFEDIVALLEIILKLYFMEINR
jgi:serine/threonine protein kinase